MWRCPLHMKRHPTGLLQVQCHVSINAVSTLTFCICQAQSWSVEAAGLPGPGGQTDGPVPAWARPALRLGKGNICIWRLVKDLVQGEKKHQSTTRNKILGSNINKTIMRNCRRLNIQTKSNLGKVFNEYFNDDVLEFDVHHGCHGFLLWPHQRGPKDHTQVGHGHQVELVLCGYPVCVCGGGSYNEAIGVLTGYELLRYWLHKGTHTWQGVLSAVPAFPYSFQAACEPKSGQHKPCNSGHRILKKRNHVNVTKMLIQTVWICHVPLLYCYNLLLTISRIIEINKWVLIYTKDAHF